MHARVGWEGAARRGEARRSKKAEARAKRTKEKGTNLLQVSRCFLSFFCLSSSFTVVCLLGCSTFFKVVFFRLHLCEALSLSSHTTKQTKAQAQTKLLRPFSPPHYTPIPSSRLLMLQLTYNNSNHLIVIWHFFDRLRSSLSPLPKEAQQGICIVSSLVPPSPPPVIVHPPGHPIHLFSVQPLLLSPFLPLPYAAAVVVACLSTCVCGCA